MRDAFSQIIKEFGRRNKKTIFLTGDLGFNALEGTRTSFGRRFINMGVSEQNMISVAAGLASEGFKVICYSIAPFAVFRPAEQIRLDVCLHNMDVKIVGNGGGYGYGIMGGTHHAIEDIAVLSSFQNMICYIPSCAEDTAIVTKTMMKRSGPGYLRLGRGNLPSGIKLPAYRPVRKIISGNKVTVITFGPILLNLLEAASSLPKNTLDLFVVSELPMFKLPKELIESINRTRKLIIYEEHVRRGGLGENLALLLAENQMKSATFHFSAKGYPGGVYGSQAFHQRQSLLDSKSMIKIISRVCK